MTGASTRESPRRGRWSSYDGGGADRGNPEGRDRAVGHGPWDAACGRSCRGPDAGVPGRVSRAQAGRPRVARAGHGIRHAPRQPSASAAGTPVGLGPRRPGFTMTAFGDAQVRVEPDAGLTERDRVALK